MQRRSSQFSLGLRRRGSLSSEVDRISHELTDEELFEFLNRKNEQISNSGWDTLRLPSDVLREHRSKPRFDNTSDSVLPTTNSNKLRRKSYRNIASRQSKSLNITELRKLTNLNFEEDEPLVKGCFAGCTQRLKEFYKDTTILNRTLNRIQGRFGSAIMEYFSFVKWLVMLNIFLSLLTLPIILPYYLMEEEPVSINNAHSTQDGNVSFKMIAQNCSGQYRRLIQDNIKGPEFLLDNVLDFIQGDGFMANTPLFYGQYSPRMYTQGFTYDMGVAFVLVTFTSLFISFIIILRSLSTYQKRSLVRSGTSEATREFSIGVLASWDFGIFERKSVKIKRSMIRQGLLELLTQKVRKAEINQRTTSQKVGLWIVRIIVNIIVLAIFTGCGAAIIIAETRAKKFLAEIMVEDETLKTGQKLLNEYLSTLIISAIYLIIPNIFYLIVKFEKYLPKNELSITMARILCLRLFSLLFLLITTFDRLKCNSKEECSANVGVTNCGNLLFSQGDLTLNKCWETHLGQQIYKLIILDFVILLLVTYLLEYPRQALYKRFSNTSLMKRIGQQEFDMPKNVMDVLYTQTLSWIGVFFSPFLPFMAATKLFLFFWIKRGTLFSNQKPSNQLSTTSAVSFFFMLVMLLSLILAYIVLVVFMQFIPPSQSCGPFQVYLTEDFKISHTVTRIFEEIKIGQFINFINSIPVITTVFVALLVLCYFFITMSNGLSAKEKLYMEQYRKAVTDRQFLLDRVNKAITQMHGEEPAPSSTSGPSVLTGEGESYGAQRVVDDQGTQHPASSQSPLPLLNAEAAFDTGSESSNYSTIKAIKPDPDVNSNWVLQSRKHGQQQKFSGSRSYSKLEADDSRASRNATYGNYSSSTLPQSVANTQFQFAASNHVINQAEELEADYDYGNFQKYGRQKLLGSRQAWSVDSKRRYSQSSDESFSHDYDNFAYTYEREPTEPAYIQPKSKANEPEPDYD